MISKCRECGALSDGEAGVVRNCAGNRKVV